MMMYEVWGRGGRVSAHADKGLANKTFRRQDAPAALTLGASLLAVRDGTTPKQRAAIEHAVALAHAGDAKIEVPRPDPAAPKTHRTPLVARRPVEAEDDETDVETDEREPETDDETDVETDEREPETDDESDSDDELPTADAPRDTEPAALRPAVAAAPAPAPATNSEVPMALKSPPRPASGTPCAARGCVNTIPPRLYQRSSDVSWRTRYCRVCCDRARHAIKAGRATVETLAAYLDRTDRRDTSAATAARLAKRASGTPTAKRAPKRVEVKVTRKARPVAPPQAVESTGETITVTITLPDDVARAHRCALSVGGVDRLEQLVNAILAVRP